MQIGDPKKTFPLLIVAILAVGFCYKQLFGGASEPKVLRQATDASAQPTPSGTLAMLQLDKLHTDPFSHPRLAPKGAPDPAATAAGASPQPPVSPNAGQKGTPLPPPFGNGDTSIDKTMDKTWPILVHPGQQPEGNQVQVVKVTQVTLKAIVKVNQRLAYLTVDGQEARGFHAGEIIKDDIQVAFVNEDSVIVKSGTKTVTLKVGQQGDL